jgi:hypothetical protein
MGLDNMGLALKHSFSFSIEYKCINQCSQSFLFSLADATMAVPKKPMEEFEEEFIKLEIDEIAAKHKFDESLRGKWMMFFENESMNGLWAKAVELYSAGELPGIISIKTSTAAPCERSGTTEYGAIRFTCGPHTDRERVLQYGQQLVKKMQYFNVDFGFVAYKTDAQSRIGTKATGAKKNYLYRMPVPTNDHLDQRYLKYCSYI